MNLLEDPRLPNDPYPELRQVLGLFVEETVANLLGNLTGIYLVGSIATGDFDLDSDLDYLVVTNTELTEADINGNKFIVTTTPGDNVQVTIEGQFVSDTSASGTISATGGGCETKATWTATKK